MVEQKSQERDVVLIEGRGGTEGIKSPGKRTLLDGDYGSSHPEAMESSSHRAGSERLEPWVMDAELSSAFGLGNLDQEAESQRHGDEPGHDEGAADDNRDSGEEGGGSEDSSGSTEEPSRDTSQVKSEAGDEGSKLSDLDRFFAASPPPAGGGQPTAIPAPSSTVDVAAPPLGEIAPAGTADPLERSARAATEGASVPVPHLAQLQRAFGPDHDLSSLRAQLGGKPEQAAELGAKHFAFGSRLYFGHSPTVGEAAHEVAHALLQRNGRGPAGHQQDPAAEAHADQVASRVESGESVADLLPKPNRGQTVAKVQRQATPGQDFLQSSWELINEAGILHDDAGARLRTAPSQTALYVTLPQNTKVQILKHNPTAKWYAVVTAEGQLGYIAEWLVWRFLPEPSANIYLVKRGDTPLDIARTHYGASFDRWGQDLRFVINALVYVNNKTRHNGVGGPGLSKPGGVNESWLKAKAAEDVKIWLPSADYLNSIYEQVREHGGGTGSISFDTFAGVADKVGIASIIPAYVGGLAHGFLACLGDTVQAIFGLIKSVFTGSIIEDLKKLWAALSKLTIKDIVEGLGSWAQSWTPRLLSENHFVRGHAWGYFAGYLCAEIAMFALGGAALNAIKATKLATKLGRVIAKVAPKLTAAVGKVTAAGRASVQALGEAKDAVLRRFGQATAAVRELASRAAWNRTAVGKRMRKLFGEAADDAFRPIGGGRVDIHGELKISGPALDSLSDDDLRKLVKLCKDKGPADAYAYFEASSTVGGKPGSRLRFDSRLSSRAKTVSSTLLDDLGLSAGDARAKPLREMTDGDKARLWDLFNEQAFKNAEMRKQAVQWAMEQNPKSARELVAQMQFFEAEVTHQGTRLFREAVEVNKQALDDAVQGGRELNALQQKAITRQVSKQLLGREFDVLGPAAERQARTFALSRKSEVVTHAATMHWRDSVGSLSGANAARPLAIGNSTDGALPGLITRSAGNLNFSNAADGAYHAHKHAAELGIKVSSKSEVSQYLAEARALIQRGGGRVRHNQVGSRSVVFEHGGRRAIVTISVDGEASIATFGVQ